MLSFFVNGAQDRLRGLARDEREVAAQETHRVRRATLGDDHEYADVGLFWERGDALGETFGDEVPAGAELGVAQRKAGASGGLPHRLGEREAQALRFPVIKPFGAAGVVGGGRVRVADLDDVREAVRARPVLLVLPREGQGPRKAKRRIQDEAEHRIQARREGESQRETNTSRCLETEKEAAQQLGCGVIGRVDPWISHTCRDYLALQRFNVHADTFHQQVSKD
ncbi:hypothetical protein NUW54_g8960 [Trametes sanguinea]|uniref:Uncharacterized protein n=1 Tax=Trametes sanguinea TaxID=158606 RepID=A0ACC1P9N3_9APHY|nr:hypothetical protein NUW54_g8960 [Trametes sanguinea]